MPCVPAAPSAPHSLSTGLELQNTKSCKILPEIFTVTFENTNEFYTPGMPYTGTVMGGSPHPAGLPCTLLHPALLLLIPSSVLLPLPSAPHPQPNLRHLPFPWGADAAEGSRRLCPAAAAALARR